MHRPHNVNAIHNILSQSTPCTLSRHPELCEQKYPDNPTRSVGSQYKTQYKYDMVLLYTSWVYCRVGYDDQGSAQQNADTIGAHKQLAGATDAVFVVI